VANLNRRFIMFFDTETTGRTDFKLPYNHPTQPNLIQLGYKVVDPSNRQVIFEMGHLVNTTKFPQWNGIEDGAFQVHKITEESVRGCGLDPEQALTMFTGWALICSVFVAHNDQFDIGVIQCCASRAELNPDIFGDGKPFCTMKSTTNICKIPGKYGNKWPTLAEAYAFFNNGATFTDAHNALADVNACENIFWHLADKRLLPEGLINVQA
jgi:DNA polymerase-3 subunit epsilon